MACRDSSIKRPAITGKGHDLSNPINICQQLCLANSVAHDNINNNGNPGKAKDKTRPDAIIKAAKENQKLCDDNVKLKLRLKHVREQTFSECSQILDSIMTYCDAKARNTGQRQKVIGEGRGPRTGAGCGEGLCGGYTPSGWNKLKTIGAMDTCPDILPDECGGGTAGSDRSQGRAPPAGGAKPNMRSASAEGSEAARSGVSGASTSGGNSKFRPSARLLGEMAFQLERRVLDYVFGLEGAKKRRFYGYTVSNICYMMEKESTSPDGGSDVIGRTEMTCRLRKILCALEKYGYDIKIHADFSQEIINKYGLLPSPPDDKTIQTFGLNDACTIACLISRLSKRQSEVHNLNILLNCLHFLSKCDGRPLFVW